MEVDENHVQTLLCMGFPNEKEIRIALKIGKNDLNEAVAVLTNEQPLTSYDFDTDTSLDVEMYDMGSVRQEESPARHVVFGPENRDSQSQVPQQLNKGTDVECSTEDMVDAQPSDYNPLEFPVTNLYELEERVFTEHWSIPYKKEESLGKCLLAATRLAEAGLAESDENCYRFMERCLPEAFQKLLTSGTVHRWAQDIQEGIYNMLQLLVDLVATRLHHLPVPVGLLDILNTAFNPECEFHYKNKVKKPDRSYRDDTTDTSDEIFTVRTSAMNNGWLVNLINRFGEKGGLDRMRELLESEESLDAPAMAAVLRPCGSCAEYLNHSLIQTQFSAAIKRTISYVQSLQENDFKEKKVVSVCDLLASLKLLYIHTAPSQTDDIDALRLNIILRMLTSPHFNAKMNSLKELSKLIEESTDPKKHKTAINTETIVTWLAENNILAVSLDGNIDQAQYCDKVKGIVEFLGSNLTLDDLSMIWKIQNGQTNNVIDNIHSIIAAAAIKFYPQQLEHLFLLIQKNWTEDSDRVREKLLTLIGTIGKDAKIPETTTKVLELLWDLAHLPVLSTHLMEQALDAHLSILNDSYIVKESVKRQYVTKCIDDIRTGVWVLPAIKQLLHISKNLLRQSFQKTDKGILHELQKTHDVIKLISQSLVKCHRLSVSAANGQPLAPDLSTDGRYCHSDFVHAHLSFLQYILQEGVLYLHSSRARDIWATLIANPDACDWDRETCYEWFSKGLSDLQPDTQSQLFQKEVLKLDPTKLSQQGFSCVKSFFECVNLYEDKLKKSGNNFIVEKCDLSGLDYLWEICLNTPDESIANNAISLLLSYSYTNLAPRLKKDSLVLHKKFIGECYTRLESARLSLGRSSLAYLITITNKVVIAPTVTEAANLPAPSKSTKLVNIERLLWIAERYVTHVEGNHCDPRSILPHGVSYHGDPINVFINCESTKQEFAILCHTNETLSSLRDKVANQLHQTSDNIQIVANEKVLSTVKDEKLLHQLDFEDNQMILVRFFSPTSIQTTPTKEPPPTPTAKQSFDLEQEKMLPGVVMAAEGQVFDMLYQLAELDKSKITQRVRHLLMLIPTDPAVSDAFDSISQKGLKLSPSSDDSSSPRSSPKKSHPSPSIRVSPKDTLKSLLDITGPDMTAFRLLYNLEVLSGKLMPTTRDVVMQQSAHVFCEDFLLAGGLNMVVNILQKESIPMDLDNETRQGCYSISLQLARFLLCGLKVTDPTVPHLPTPVKPPYIDHVSPLTTAVSPPSIEIPSTTGSRAIQTMGETEFTETLSCFMTVTWAAAAGRLRLVASTQPIRESTSWTTAGRRSRQNSTGSTGSTGSEGDNQSLHAGVCIQKTTISHTDTNIAKEALELLVTCLQLRSRLMPAFYMLPCVNEFIIDLLVGSTQVDIRTAALDQFFLLTQTVPDDSTCDAPTNCHLTPHQFILQVLLKAYLPFWVSSTTTRGASQRLLSQCSQYFDLRCRLLENLSESYQNKMKINPTSMLEDEVAWLSNFTPSDDPELKVIDNNLLAGHLNLMTTLLTCESVDKDEFGGSLVPDVLNEFLFPAAKLMTASDISETKDDILHNFNPKCSNGESRLAAYNLLTELANDCLVNLRMISTQLLAMHHHTQAGATEWEYMPPVVGRAECGFVGLKNAGATCYMNSVIQQLYMTPGISEYILSVDSAPCDEDSVFYQVQQMMGDLMESKLQYHVPDKFWKVFKLWGQPINVREQQDAFDFFQALIDQIDEHLKSVGKERLFMNRFQGVYSDQKICKDCPHRYEREEVFYALNVTVKNATLQDSLDQFVKGELLDGDNAYFCEKCGEKRNTIKRLCIKTLPPTLCIQLKRFGYDWESNRALKFDDFFKFPWTLDMEPYTAEGMSSREMEDSGSGSNCGGDGDPPDKGGGDGSEQSAAFRHQINYDLVGIVVHSGQANAGHYYSYIKDRRGRVMTNPHRGKWFKFNDTIVEEFEMTEASIEEECFGGTYKLKVFDQANAYPEERQRYWNGYMLFYERVDDPGSTGSAKKTKLSTPRKYRLSHGNNRSGRGDSDSLIELTQLIHKGDKRGIFLERMPASIQQSIRAENITFIKNRDVYNVDYFHFVRDLVDVNSKHDRSVNFSNLSVQSMQLGLQFLFNTYFRSCKKLRSDMDEWVDTLDRWLANSRDACLWLVSYLSSEPGSGYIKLYLLECPNKDVRVTFAQILEKMIVNYFHHGGRVMAKNFTEICEGLLRMLNKDVMEHYKNSVQYFGVLKSYVQLGTQACAHLFGRNAFQRLLFFLLGHPVTTGEQQETNYRHWSTYQARDFGHLHTTISLLILNCDVTEFYTEDVGNHKPPTPSCVSPRVILKMSAAMKSYVFGPESTHYIKEVVHAVREVNSSQTEMVEMLAYCSFCNEHFTNTLLTQITMQFLNAPSNELKMLLTLLHTLLVRSLCLDRQLMLEDPLQLKRIQLIVDGTMTLKDSNYDGLLSIIRSDHITDSRRSYQCIKFLVTLANRCQLAKDYLLQAPNKWQWAVDWLKRKMTEYFWNPPSSVTVSNDDSNRKSFQRTVSAQDTLDEATALLTELEAADGVTEMETSMSPTPDVDTTTKVAALQPSGDGVGDGTVIKQAR